MRNAPWRVSTLESPPTSRAKDGESGDFDYMDGVERGAPVCSSGKPKSLDRTGLLVRMYRGGRASREESFLRTMLSVHPLGYCASYQ